MFIVSNKNRMYVSRYDYATPGSSNNNRRVVWKRSMSQKANDMRLCANGCVYMHVCVHIHMYMYFNMRLCLCVQKLGSSVWRSQSKANIIQTYNAGN